MRKLSRGQPALRATLIAMEKKAGKREATAQADALNVNIIDPAVAGEAPRPGQAHFHYQVDTGMVVATTLSKLSFSSKVPPLGRNVPDPGHKKKPDNQR